MGGFESSTEDSECEWKSENSLPRSEWNCDRDEVHVKSLTRATCIHLRDLEGTELNMLETCSFYGQYL